MILVAGKKGQDLGMNADDKFFRNLVRDIKHIGLVYIKSASVADKIKRHDPDIQITYNKEDRTYSAFYNKPR